MPTPKTSDIGLLIRDMIEDREFDIYDLSGDEPEVVGKDEVSFVDVSDANNPVVTTVSGKRFVVRVIDVSC